MTPEPKDVQLARMVTEILSGDSTEKADDAYSMAKSIVDAHEANIEVGRKQAEERQRAIEETARRWPELARDRWRYVESEYNLSFRHPERTNVYIDKDEGILSSYSNGEECQTDSAVVLALIDAAGRNTTADKLKDERDFWQKKHADDNEGLMFQLGRNLEFAQQVAFRHGATEPHATIKCIQIIDEHASSIERQLADGSTTADRLRDAIQEANDCLDNGCQGRAGEILRDALLETSNG